MDKNIQEGIIAGNKLIAESPFCSEFVKSSVIHYKARNEVGYKEYLATLQYHTSWDWLMPVVEKIEDMKLSVTIRKTNITIYGNPDGKYCNIEVVKYGLSKIEIIWLAVVEFIKWYNQNKQQ